MRPISPLFGQVLPVFTANIHPLEGTGDGIKPGGIDDDVDLVLSVRRLNTLRRDALDRG